MSCIQVGSIIGGILVGMTYVIWKEVRGLEEKIDRQVTRTDKLYEMFIDLLKEERR